MSTFRQKGIAKLIIENATLDKPLNGGEIVEKGRYSKSMQIKPSLVLESAGVQEALEDYGFNDDNAKKVVSEILLNPKIKPDTRINAAKEVFKVRGSYAAEKTTSLNLNVEARIEDKSGLEALREEYEEKLKAKLIQ
ncbi:MAG: hypothetical protein AAB706_00895 [Patescibacteria group bacterium]